MGVYGVVPKNLTPLGNPPWLGDMLLLNAYQWPVCHGWCTKDRNGQITAGVERCCACCHRHSEVWSCLGQILHDQLHWLDVPDWVLFKLAVTVYQCLNDAHHRISEHCIPVSSADMRRHLRSANRHLLAVPRFWLNTYGRWTFSVAGPMAWNSLPDFPGIQRAAHTVLRVYSKILVRAILVHPAH